MPLSFTASTHRGNRLRGAASVSSGIHQPSSIVTSESSPTPIALLFQAYSSRRFHQISPRMNRRSNLPEAARAGDLTFSARLSESLMLVGLAQRAAGTL
jgi:hypothetical protein